MGPGCFHPRNYTVTPGVSIVPLTSMGPGCFHPRNVAVWGASDALFPLQWGRDVSIPEMRQNGSTDWTPTTSMGPGCFHPRNRIRSLSTFGVLASLQWGRDVSIPEMNAAGTATVATKNFNGAGMF